ncbi:MAG: ferritin-like domain-containing protein [Chthoniobacterales bacterium]
MNIPNPDFETNQLAGFGLSDRRQMLKRLGLGALGLTGLNLLASQVQAATQTSDTDQDVAVLQFALNLEYLEAEYYTYAVTGHGIEEEGVEVFGSGNPGHTKVKDNPKVPFADRDVELYATEIAQDERRHVTFIRTALQSLGVTPAARPEINLATSWNKLARAAGLVAADGFFNPFADDVSFLLGAFVFEDVGVTAYHGGAPLLGNKSVLSAAAGILAVEAYHAAIVRTTLLEEGREVIQAVKKISDLRDALDGSSDLDEGISKRGGISNLVPTDHNGIAFARTVRQVLNIVYFAQDVDRGVFFPTGINPG